MSKEMLAAIVQKDESLGWISGSLREQNDKRADAWREHEVVQGSQDRTSGPDSASDKDPRW
jgi:hypothetical protein